TTHHREEVDATIERHHPPIQEVGRRDALAAEVVDDQEPVVGAHLHGCSVEARGRIELEVEHVDGELAPHHQAGPPAADPSRVAGEPSGTLDALVHVRIEHGDDLPVDFDGV